MGKLALVSCIIPSANILAPEGVGEAISGVMYHKPMFFYLKLMRPMGV